MLRGKSKRTWIKLFCYRRLHSKLNFELEEDEQSCWDKLLCLAGLCDEECGKIADNDGKAFSHLWVAHEVNSKLELLERTLVKCIKDGRIVEDTTGIQITNWKHYQSEYQRQLPSRERAKQGQEPQADLTAWNRFR